MKILILDLTLHSIHKNELHLSSARTNWGKQKFILANCQALPTTRVVV